MGNSQQFIAMRYCQNKPLIKNIRDRILEKRSDEMRHYQIISQVYFSLTGKQYTPKMNAKCTNDYRKCILHAFKYEQETIDFYHDIQQFMQVSLDEQNHAVWFLYFANYSK